MKDASLTSMLNPYTTTECGTVDEDDNKDDDEERTGHFGMSGPKPLTRFEQLACAHGQDASLGVTLRVRCARECMGAEHAVGIVHLASTPIRKSHRKPSSIA